MTSDPHQKEAPRASLLPFILCKAALLATLFVRLTRGLDVTDEIQYYGEIKGLLESGHLFSTDLFIQQSVYVLLYPAFLLHHAWAGFDGLVLFGRLLMSGLSLALFLYAYNRLRALDTTPWQASLASLLITFAVPYHGVLAPSYNTISQATWIVFALSFLAWRIRSPLYWAALPVVTAFAHPTAAVTMSLLIFGRQLHERDFKQAFKFGVSAGLGALLMLAVLTCFASPSEFVRSLAFSSGYGVGTVFFSGHSGPTTLAEIYVLFMIAAWSSKLSSRYKLPLLLMAMIWLTVRNLRHPFPGAYDGYSARTALLLAGLSALAYAGALARVSQAPGLLTRRHVHWFAVFLLIYATTLGVTSGNGIGQATGAFMVGLPLLLAIACPQADPDSSSRIPQTLGVASMVLVAIWTVGHWCRYPYREAPWWKTNQAVADIPEFRFISTSAERAKLLSDVRATLLPDTQNKKVLIVSEYPGFYFASGGSIESCMVYMHSLTSDKSESALKDCLRNKHPDVVVDVFKNDEQAYQGDRLKAVMRQFYADAYPDCKRSVLDLAPHSDLNPTRLVMRVCKPRPIASIQP